MSRRKKLSLHYFMSINTLMLEPYMDGHRIFTRVIEDRSEFIAQDSPYGIISKTCGFYGGSLRQAIRYSQDAIGIPHKPPIIIGHEYGSPCVFFPISSPMRKDTTWFAFHGITFFEASDVPGSSIVHLANGLAVPVDVSIQSLTRQYVYSSFLIKYFEESRKSLRQQMFISDPSSVQRKYFTD
ncbi:competence protein ComK [Planococcus lenghuensis]|uniref:Competence protein n=1 Tax=Planococcus lenghuensis TaxID=2213202 RepID=A0A1Q2KWQ9_9BACL|nr:competence protein ComK [Planococcus lenghuensis]AQQ52583.1 hypothetical protein B0X71_05385 [Planococcus lenghuensis]